MTHNLGLPLALLLIVSGCRSERFDTVRNIGSVGDTIVCFGDSLTEGVGAEAREEYPTILSRLLGIGVLNAGHRGDTTAQALERIHGAVLSKNPRLVILLLGGNDFLRQVPTGETRQNLKEIVRQIQAHGAMVAIAGIKLGFFTDEYGPIFEETAAEFGAIYIPQVMKGIFTDTKLRSDQIHPNSVGYRLIAERIAERIKPLLDEADRLRGRL
jgi:acyl-CoA thioesterase-1